MVVHSNNDNQKKHLAGKIQTVMNRKISGILITSLSLITTYDGEEIESKSKCVFFSICWSNLFESYTIWKVSLENKNNNDR